MECISQGWPWKNDIANTKRRRQKKTNKQYKQKRTDNNFKDKQWILNDI